MGAEDGMWTEAHRARHEPGLKELVAACAVDEIAAWLERADPPRSGRATPVRRVVGAVAWHLRVGGPWRALAAARATLVGAGEVSLRLRPSRDGHGDRPDVVGAVRIDDEGGDAVLEMRAVAVHGEVVRVPGREMMLSELNGRFRVCR